MDIALNKIKNPNHENPIDVFIADQIWSKILEKVPGQDPKYDMLSRCVQAGLGNYSFDDVFSKPFDSSALKVARNLNCVSTFFSNNKIIWEKFFKKYQDYYQNLYLTLCSYILPPIRVAHVKIPGPAEIDVTTERNKICSKTELWHLFQLIGIIIGIEKPVLNFFKLNEIINETQKIKKLKKIILKTENYKFLLKSMELGLSSIQNVETRRLSIKRFIKTLLMIPVVPQRGDIAQLICRGKYENLLEIFSECCKELGIWAQVSNGMFMHSLLEAIIRWQVTVQNELENQLKIKPKYNHLEEEALRDAKKDAFDLIYNNSNKRSSKLYKELYEKFYILTIRQTILSKHFPASVLVENNPQQNNLNKKTTTLPNGEEVEWWIYTTSDSLNTDACGKLIDTLCREFETEQKKPERIILPRDVIDTVAKKCESVDLEDQNQKSFINFVTTSVLQDETDKILFFFLCRNDRNKKFVTAIIKNFPYLVTTKKFESLKTALHEACFQECYEIANLLLIAGADPNEKNSDGYTPFDFVHNNKKLVNLCVRYGAKLGIGK
jgi:hypothetical protein